MKVLAVLLFGMSGMSFSAIGCLMRVSDVAVLKRVQAEASVLPEAEVSAAVVTVKADEMWHVLKTGNSCHWRVHSPQIGRLKSPQFDGAAHL